jgi:hypothetical protein
MHTLFFPLSSPTDGHVTKQKSYRSKITYLTLGNVLLLVALFAFTPGFLSSALFPNSAPALSTFDDHLEQAEDDVPFSRVVFLLVDALRSDFVFAQASGFTFTQRHELRIIATVSLLSSIAIV